jgi:diguanylate cyclase (GGDEF)-like protein
MISKATDSFIRTADKADRGRSQRSIISWIPAMKRLILVMGGVLSWASIATAAPPAELTSLSAVHALSNAEANKAYPVAFEATVTSIRSYAQTMFVQEGTDAIFVLIDPDAKAAVGDRVLVRGTTKGSYRPIVVSHNVTLIRHGVLPKALPSTYDELAGSKRDCMLVTVHGAVRNADLMWNTDSANTFMQLAVDGGIVDVIVERSDVGMLDSLLDAEIEVTGIAAGQFDNKMQKTGVLLHVVSMDDIRILKRSKVDPWVQPVRPMDTIFAGVRVRYLTTRIRVHGTITYYEPGTGVVLQDGSKSLWIMTATHKDLRVGDIADATGFPSTHDGFLILAHGEIQDSHVWAPVKPLPVNWQSLNFGNAAYVGHIYDLVSIEGKVLTEVREAGQDRYVLTSNGQMLSAIYRHPGGASLTSLEGMKKIPLGSKVRVSGICLLEDFNSFSGPEPVDILLRSFDDIVVVSKPSLMNTRNLILAVSLLLGVVIVISSWSWVLRKKVRVQTATLATMAEFEQRRSRILERINGSDPLNEILEEITELVSSMLCGADCWCEMEGGITLGVPLPRQKAIHVLSSKIVNPAGSEVGTISASLDPLLTATDQATESLTVGARLAAVAIETRRLYTDLRRRSEYDLLTDIPNRFAMDKLLEARIEEARQTACLFGLIYIDLDEFKQINDQYGHHIGDRFLQEVASRMKRQLRGDDMLARLGGDEFAALVSVVQNLGDVEDIVDRLAHCFDEPFATEGYRLRGAASIGVAFYPKDGATKDELLNIADAAMYEVKNSKKPDIQAANLFNQSQSTHKICT